jgi:hypothetical protein
MLKGAYAGRRTHGIPTLPMAEIDVVDRVDLAQR